MSLGVTVGYALINARQAIPDMPQTLPATAATAAVVASIGSTLPAGVYACMVTQINDYGETIAQAETTGLVVAGNQGIQITSALQPTATKIRAYLTLPGGAAGTEQQYVESTVSPFTISAPLTGASVPPQLNRAFLPDSDGNLISAAAMFGWINDGLKIISRHAGGLTDYCGIGSVINQPLYVIPGEYNSITSVWYDGYWMMGGDRGNFWRRNTITSSILSSATISTNNNQMVLEVYPQPARNGATTTLAAPMTATDTAANLTTTGGFLLPFGFVNFDGEICAYGGINGNQLTGLIRALGGTAAAAHASGRPLAELNIFWNGKRQIFTSYVPGQASSILPIPNGWDVLLSQYVLGRAKNVEHDLQAMQSLEKNVQASINDWAKQNKGVVKRRQIGPPQSPGIYFPTQAGGLIVN